MTGSKPDYDPNSLGHTIGAGLGTAAMDFLTDGAGAELEAAEEESFVGRAAETANNDGCFVAGTPVTKIASSGSDTLLSLLWDGSSGVQTTPVEQMKQGDQVVSRDPATGKTEARRVERTTVRKVASVATVALADGVSGQVVQTLIATLEHPFYVVGKGFVEAADLGIGSQVVTRAGPPLVVKDVTVTSRREGYTVYNLVEGNHTYFVGTASKN